MYYIPSTLYGEEFDISDSHFIFDLIKKIYSGKFHNTKVELWGDGYQKRELIYVNDAIDIMIKTLNYENEILNLGSGNDNTIREFAKTICDYLNYDENKIYYDLTKYVGVRSKKIDVTKIKSFVPEMNFTDLTEGIKKTINYYKSKNEN